MTVGGEGRTARRLLRLALGARRPRAHGDLHLEQLERPVTVHRDGWGVPHIEAISERDAWFAAGFCQGQDRQFQLELLWRAGRGAMAELVGARALPLDRVARRIGFRRAALAQVPVQSGEAYGLYAAFAAGVNAAATTGPRCHELALLRRAPSRWDVADVLSVTKLVAFGLSTYWTTKIVRHLILAEGGPEALRLLEPQYRPDHPVIAPPGSPAGPMWADLSAGLADLRSVTGDGASNNWAVGSDRTVGGAIFANDPHLSPTVPMPWYLAHVSCAAWRAAGFMFVGAPGIVAGHNGTCAWGVTNGLGDNADVFAEARLQERLDDPEDPTHEIIERIRVRWGDDVEERVVITEHGPLVTPLGAGDSTAPELSLAATWLEPRPIVGFLTVARAADFESFRACFAEWPSASLNVLYADGDTVGWQFVGALPDRRVGGALPVPGDDPASAWRDEPIPFASMPSWSGGPSAFLVTANNPPTNDPAHRRLGGEWTQGFRAARIEQQLAARTDWSIPSTRALQMDVYSLPWEEVRARVLSLDVHDPIAGEALRILERWDGHVRARGSGPVVYSLFMAAVSRRLVDAVVEQTAPLAVGAGVHEFITTNSYNARRLGQVVDVLRSGTERWGGVGVDAVLRASLSEAMASAMKRLGPDRTTWDLGRLRPLTFEHPLGSLPIIGRAFDVGPIMWGGEAASVGMCTANPTDPCANPVVVATFRMVVEIGAWERATFVLPTGNSGNPTSPHYTDQLPLWEAGDGIHIAWSSQAVADATVATLRLVPA